MSEEKFTTDVRILGKEYRICSTEDERDLLQSSARFLDAKMREIRDTGRVIGTERIAVMAALNIAHESMQIHKDNDFLSSEWSERLKTLQAKMDEYLQSEDTV